MGKIKLGRSADEYIKMKFSTSLAPKILCTQQGPMESNYYIPLDLGTHEHTKNKTFFHFFHSRSSFPHSSADHLGFFSFSQRFRVETLRLVFEVLTMTGMVCPA